MNKYIFFDGKLLKRAGGPTTYLYNLKNGLHNRNGDSINFIYDDSIDEIKSENGGLYNKIKNILSKFNFIYTRLYFVKRHKCSKIYTELSKVKDGDIIMFHRTIDLVKALPFLPNNVTKILMSHSPEIQAKEIAKILKNKNNRCNEKYVEKRYFEEFDKPAFEKADIIVFPSEDAMEPYYQTCNNFSQIIKNKRIEYIETGTEELKFDFSKDEFRKIHNIPKDAFVLSFIGRHNEVKGYDSFIKIGNEMLKRHHNFYIITAGIGEIKSPRNDRWIDIGWTNDPGSVANCSDLFVLPNKRTYFDLILLEMLSIGKTCLVSNTGGNRTISNYTAGVITYDDIDSAIETIEKLYNDKALNERLCKLNQKIYNERYTIDAFANRYIDFFNKVENKK